MWDDVKNALLAAVELVTRVILMALIASAAVITFVMTFL